MSEPEKYYRVITKFSYLSELVVKARDAEEAPLNALDTGESFERVNNSEESSLYDVQEITKEEAKQQVTLLGEGDSMSIEETDTLITFEVDGKPFSLWVWTGGYDINEKWDFGFDIRPIVPDKDNPNWMTTDTNSDPIVKVHLCASGTYNEFSGTGLVEHPNCKEEGDTNE